MSSYPKSSDRFTQCPRIHCQPGMHVALYAMISRRPLVTRYLRITRMHSSRMRTGRSLTVCRSLLSRGLLGGGGVWSRGCLVWGVSHLGGLSSPGGACLLLEGGVWSWGWGCVFASGGCLLPGACLLLGGCVCLGGRGVWSQGGHVCFWGGEPSMH